MNYDCEFSSYNNVPEPSTWDAPVDIFLTPDGIAFLRMWFRLFFWKVAANKCRFFLFNWSQKTREHIVTPCFRVFQYAECYISKCSFSISSPTSLHFFLIRTTLNTTSHDLQESYIHMQQSQGKHWHSEQAVACWKGKRGDVLRILSTRLDMLIVKCTGRFSE